MECACTNFCPHAWRKNICNQCFHPKSCHTENGCTFSTESKPPLLSSTKGHYCTKSSGALFRNTPPTSPLKKSSENKPKQQAIMGPFRTFSPHNFSEQSSRSSKPQLRHSSSSVSHSLKSQKPNQLLQESHVPKMIAINGKQQNAELVAQNLSHMVTFASERKKTASGHEDAQTADHKDVFLRVLSVCMDVLGLGSLTEARTLLERAEQCDSTNPPSGARAALNAVKEIIGVCWTAYPQIELSAAAVDLQALIREQFERTTLNGISHLYKEPFRSKNVLVFSLLNLEKKHQKQLTIFIAHKDKLNQEFCAFSNKLSSEKKKVAERMFTELLEHIISIQQLSSNLIELFEQKTKQYPDIKDVPKLYNDNYEQMIDDYNEAYASAISIQSPLMQLSEMHFVEDEMGTEASLFCSSFKEIWKSRAEIFSEYVAIDYRQYSSLSKASIERLEQDEHIARDVLKNLDIVYESICSSPENDGFIKELQSEIDASSKEQIESNNSALDIEEDLESKDQNEKQKTLAQNRTKESVIQTHQENHIPDSAEKDSQMQTDEHEKTSKEVNDLDNCSNVIVENKENTQTVNVSIDNVEYKEKKNSEIITEEPSSENKEIESANEVLPKGVTEQHSDLNTDDHEYLERTESQADENEGCTLSENHKSINEGITENLLLCKETLTEPEVVSNDIFDGESCEQNVSEDKGNEKTCEEGRKNKSQHKKKTGKSSSEQKYNEGQEKEIQKQEIAALASKIKERLPVDLCTNAKQILLTGTLLVDDKKMEYVLFNNAWLIYKSDESSEIKPTYFFYEKDRPLIYDEKDNKFHLYFSQKSANYKNNKEVVVVTIIDIVQQKEILSYASFKDNLNKAFHDAKMAKIKTFGVPLPVLLSYENSGDSIPQIVRQCISFLKTSHLDTEGLFRLGGRRGKLEEIHRLFDERKNNINLSVYSGHEVATILKRWLIELPQPLIDFDAQEALITCNETDYTEMNKALKLLSSSSYSLLKYVINFLALLSKRQKVNKLTPYNISIVLTQSLCRVDDPIRSVSLVKIVQSLIEHFEDIFS